MGDSVFQRVVATMLGEALSWGDFSDAWDDLPQSVRDGVLRDMAQALEKRVADLSADASLREQVRTLTTDNAAQHKALLGVEHVFDRDDSRYYCPECGKERPAHDEACSIGHALHGAHSPGAALLAEMDSLRARVAELENAGTVVLGDEGISDALGDVKDAGLERVASLLDRHLANRARLVAALSSQRDAAQQRAKALEEALRETAHALTLGEPELIGPALLKAQSVLTKEES